MCQDGGQKTPVWPGTKTSVTMVTCPAWASVAEWLKTVNWRMQRKPARRLPFIMTPKLSSLCSPCLPARLPACRGGTRHPTHSATRPAPDPIPGAGQINGDFTYGRPVADPGSMLAFTIADSSSARQIYQGTPNSPKAKTPRRKRVHEAALNKPLGATFCGRSTHGWSASSLSPLRLGIGQPPFFAAAGVEIADKG